MPGKRYAFVLRVWNEASSSPSPQPDQVRGSLQLADADRIFYFSSLAQIPHILQEITGWHDETAAANTQLEVQENDAQ
ncbi:MAG: hypothetical protein ACE5FD_13125 [Anaerolineae bacterium]